MYIVVSHYLCKYFLNMMHVVMYRVHLLWMPNLFELRKKGLGKLEETDVEVDDLESQQINV